MNIYLFIFLLQILIFDSLYFSEIPFSALPTLFHPSGVGFVETLIIYSNSVGTRLNSTPICKGDDSFSFYWKSVSEFLKFILNISILK